MKRVSTLYGNEDHQVIKGKRLFEFPKNFMLDILSNGLKRYFSKQIPVKKVRNFLFVQCVPFLGTALSITPVFETIRKRFPEGHIAAVCSDMVYQVLKYNPNIDEIYTVPHSGEILPKATFPFLKLRKERAKYDCLIGFSSRFRDSFLSFLTRVKYRISFDSPHGFLYSLTIPYSSRLSVVENNLRLLRIFDELPESIDSEPKMYFSEKEILFVEEFFKRKKIDRNGLVMAIQTQSRDEKPNRWFDERFARLADEIVDTFDANIIFTGASGEIQNIERIREKMAHPSFSAAGETDIPQLSALLSLCDLLITLDTGVMHVGRGVGVPMVIIACAYQPRHLWLPIGTDKHVVLIKDNLPCARCFKDSCATRECMRAITVEEVFAAVECQINRFTRKYKREGKKDGNA